MPLIDMPLDQLRTYNGLNPCPKDIDQYWDAAIKEMKAVDPKIEITPASFQFPNAECFDLWFTGVRGARIHAKYLRPKNAAPKHPAVVMFHGYSGHAGDWTDKLNWCNIGYSITALDARGQGGLSEDIGTVKGTTLHGHIIRGLNDSPEKLLFRDIYLDCAQLAGITMNLPEVDADRVGAFGGSQGGGLTLACASLEPRIKRAAPMFPFLCDYKRVWEMDLAKDAYIELKNFFRHHDPRHERENEIFTRLGYIDCQHIAKRIRGDVLMATGLIDTICPPSTQFAAYNKITSKKDVVIYPDHGHEGLPEWNDLMMQFMLGL